MDATYIKTMGMSCAGCSRLVEKCIGRLDGVVAVESDEHRGLTRVVFDPIRIDEFHISDRIRELGFVTRVVSYPQSLAGALARDPWECGAGDSSAGAQHGSGDPDVHVIHVRTSGLRCDECTSLVERTLSQLEGVMEVMSVRALGLTSVLFDESIVDRSSIIEEIRGAGFEANAVQ